MWIVCVSEPERDRVWLKVVEALVDILRVTEGFPWRSLLAKVEALREQH